AGWLKRSVDSGRAVFQPWNMELLYVIATLGRARFGQLAQLLGLSSRTLSDKLLFLCEAGLVAREVFDERPVRIEYQLTKHGRATAALASPLIAHLNHEGRQPR
ncbi:MAG TPA: winged helix-turn-helix transcriptional regulator, partial [Candidatus Thermoplasmatota archaeon]|nr:winged helix-turn-helix transcriptional regulator [Candidatus Thermoplasmatota archaeon]